MLGMLTRRGKGRVSTVPEQKEPRLRPRPANHRLSVITAEFADWKADTSVDTGLGGVGTARRRVLGRRGFPHPMLQRGARRVGRRNPHYTAVVAAAAAWAGSCAPLQLRYRATSRRQVDVVVAVEKWVGRPGSWCRGPAMAAVSKTQPAADVTAQNTYRLSAVQPLVVGVRSGRLRSAVRRVLLLRGAGRSLRMRGRCARVVRLLSEALLRALLKIWNKKTVLLAATTG